MDREIKAYSIEELTGLVLGLGQPRFRADQLFQWLYLHGASDYEEMTNLPLALRNSLAQRHPVHETQVVDRRVAQDGTRKYLLEFADGARVEAVAIPSFADPEAGREPMQAFAQALAEETASGASGASGAKRLTLCFSTQVGCPMACTFCASGTEGLSRNLLPGEIVDQVFVAQKDFGARVGNLVAMGQGEPFLNYENTLAALRILNNPKGLNIGARHITLSTCGIISGVRRFSCEPEQFNLAVSLHSAQQEVRNRLMPKLSVEPLHLLKDALLNYVESTNRRVTLEYALIEGLNDTAAAFDSLLRFCSGLLCHVNLLPINPIAEESAAAHDEVPRFSPSPAASILRWQTELEKARVPVSLRQSRGLNIAGACGQLKSQRA
ncbi:MAG: 23S rRNA (adenine(2503)-C(2))-methyltransferase RlmN [Eggerthellaceae bacterium]|nr:23S rRNA (adenine(2503)-C(2))-methyltransferase RlmN [Eggerthellaceae bacterium]